MRLGTIRRDGDTVAVVVEGDSVTVLSASDVGEVLAHGLGDRVQARTATAGQDDALSGSAALSWCRQGTWVRLSESFQQIGGG
jgi:hypothetical protein